MRNQLLNVAPITLFSTESQKKSYQTETLVFTPEDVAQEQGSVVSESPVVIQRVDGGSQGLQDAVHNTRHQAAHIRAQVQVWVLDQAPHHVQKSVELLQVMAYRLHLEHNIDMLG